MPTSPDPVIPLTAPSAPSAPVVVFVKPSPVTPDAPVDAAALVIPAPPVAATLTLGSGNSALAFTAIPAGPGGNSITVALAGNTTDVAASASGAAITVAYGAKHFMIVTINGSHEILGHEAGGWSSAGLPFNPEAYNVAITGVPGAWRLDYGNGSVIYYENNASSAAFPDGVTGWAEYNDLPVTVAASAAHADLVASTVNAAGLQVSCVAGGDGTGAVAAASATHLAGGTGLALPDPVI